MVIGLWLASLLLALLTLLPLWRFEAWWVRGLDFPRLQLAVLAGVIVTLQLLFTDLTRLNQWPMLLISSGCLIFQLWWIVPYTPLFRKEVMATTADNTKPCIAILNANVLGPNRNAQALIDLVNQHQPDILVTLESNSWWQQQLDQLSDKYGYSVKCPLDNLYGMHVYSRLPLHNTAIQFLVEDNVPSIHAEAELDDGSRIAVHFLHPAPPSPTENPSSEERDAELLVMASSVKDVKTPVIVAGDLNDVAWSETTRLFRKISGLLDPRIGRGMFNSYHADYPFMRWPLDHLFHSSHFTLQHLQRLPSIGSDHFPMLIRLCYTGQQRPQDGIDPDQDDKELAQDKMMAQAVSPEQVHRPEALAVARLS
ncbi:MULTISPECIES: endonuclease/exonuclease/phosphatase family protein [unclassified Arsukibacterium]|uniref:endonuclease/exonuclease/phosphatase family protein n=1 Tax=unclassified Arsukibacterium TaxID=2635278 RepID=UPI000C511509|nr:MULTISPECIES: endonuclease/exonuclease/phosphatase family protein [unclassified Arsukibacterium]MAA95184.1 endonuclease [Rheinheimera sp.]MBM35141.1 endonuclease [Rheinheimera sp.]HAW93512.1 endonuclease [Candidatus Azambacteria bacterium]|tara:strand:+ start:1896 stop:2996 length:1101 start_codon:yes stop_codon:yes gene_type:complete